MLIDHKSVKHHRAIMKTNTQDQIVIDQLNQLMEKYSLLIYLCRLKPFEFDDPEITNMIDKVIAQYPEDSKKITIPISNDWHYGFFSGIFACAKFIMAIKCQSLDVAIDGFPNLDISSNINVTESIKTHHIEPIHEGASYPSNQ